MVALQEVPEWVEGEMHGDLADMTQFDGQRLHMLITNHARYTGSRRAADILANWREMLPKVPQGHAARVQPRACRNGQGARHGSRRVKSGHGKSHRVSLEFERTDRDYEPVEERICHYREFVLPLPVEETQKQAARCMDCGVPYCHGTDQTVAQPTGCPVNNQIPDWNDLVYKGNWEEAARNLHSTNNFPEVTGRVCPAPCEASCTLNIDDNPVAIKTIECAIADRAFESGWIMPQPAPHKTGKTIAVVGSGPAGMACAQQLARAGHDVHLFEKHAKAGGLMRYRHPRLQDGKEHRRHPRQADGRRTPSLHYGQHVGQNLPAETLLKDYYVVALLVWRGGRARPADPGPRSRRHPLRDGFPAAAEPAQDPQVRKSCRNWLPPILAKGKHVVVIGGGDTGSDCIGTSIRQGALSVTNFETSLPRSRRSAKTRP